MAMEEKKAHNGRTEVNGTSNGSKWTGVIVSGLLAACGASGGIYVALGTPIGKDLARPDPWTASQAHSAHQALARETQTTYDRLDARVKIAEDHIKQHPDAELRAAIADLRAAQAASKATQTIILANQARILDRLDAR